MGQKQAEGRLYQYKPGSTSTHTATQSANRILHVSIRVLHNFLDCWHGLHQIGLHSTHKIYPEISNFYLVCR
jgi:hypothetical protein